ncbi:MAG: FtsQ-type POTRA domain-containing protein [Chloroflexi bacterium]|nr:FtsQ-type POTRA domain-containing protein [Chloroflexota bacterium]
MSIRRQQAAGNEKNTPRRTRRKRQVVGALPRVRVVKPEPVKQTPTRRTQKRATFEIAAPRVTLNPWRTTRDWRASRPKFFAGVFFVLLLAALWAMFNLDLFFVSEPVVVGNKIVPRAEIAQVSGVNGWNIFFVEPRAVARAVRALPEFKDVQVYVTLPNQVEIYTTERVPRFVWEVAGKNFWVDQEGIAMRPRGMVPNGWHVRDAEGKAVKYGERINPDAFNAAVSLINVWKDAPKYFEWTKTHGLQLRDEHGWLIYFGSANQMNDKLTALQIVTTQLLRDKRAVAFIDLGSGLPYYQEVAVKK